MRVYISGQITSDEDCEKKFLAKENELKEFGYSVCNPFKKGKVLEKKLGRALTLEERMEYNLSLLSECDGIAFLTNWEKSQSTNEEHEFAVKNNKVTVKIKLLR